LDDVGRAYDFAQERNLPITLLLGRHTIDTLVSFYMRTASGFDIVFGAGGELLDDAFVQVNPSHSAEIIQDLVVPKPAQRGSFRFPGTLLVRPPAATSDRFGRRRFPRSTGLVAHKIGNVATDRHLAAELAPLYLVRAKYSPEPPFGLGHVLS
jgi:hypothetical protein